MKVFYRLFNKKTFHTLNYKVIMKVRCCKVKNQCIALNGVSFKTITDVIFKHFDKNIEEAKTLMDKINSNKQERTVTKLRLGVNKEDRKSNSRNLNKIINETPESDQNFGFVGQ